MMVFVAMTATYCVPLTSYVSGLDLTVRGAGRTLPPPASLTPDDFGVTPCATSRRLSFHRR